MLNRICLQGRLTKDPEVRNTQNQSAVASFTVACDRPFKNDNGSYDADFINCVAWRQTATFLGHYFHKGDMIVLSGRLQTRTYDDRNGNKVFVTEVIVEEANFGGSPAKKNTNTAAVEPNFEEATDDIPFEV